VHLPEHVRDEVVPHRRDRHDLKRLDACTQYNQQQSARAPATRPMCHEHCKQPLVHAPRTKTAARMPPCRRGRHGRPRQSTETAASGAAAQLISTSISSAGGLSVRPTEVNN
jgi:hypothetical protein